MGAMAFALVVAAGLGVALGLLPSALGREADLVLRVGLGALAAIPIFVLVLLVAVIAGLSATLVPLALGLLFVPIVFRDVRDLAAKAVDPGSVRGIASLVPGRMLGRVEAGLVAAVPGYLARLPRRAAEIALLLETLSFIGFGAGGTADWASEINFGVAFVGAPGGNLWPLYVPAILLILFLLGLLFLSDGVRLVLDPPSSTPEPRGAVLPPPLPADANP
jgi:peptide/nickel transport system permease protein